MRLSRELKIVISHPGRIEVEAREIKPRETVSRTTVRQQSPLILENERAKVVASKCQATAQ